MTKVNLVADIQTVNPNLHIAEASQAQGQLLRYSRSVTVLTGKRRMLERMQEEGSVVDPDPDP